MPPEPAPRIVGRRLAEARRLRGIALEAASEHLGIDRLELTAIEAGDRIARPSEIIAMAKLYDRTVHHFVRVADEAEPNPADSDRFRAHVIRAYEQGHLSEMQLADRLGRDIWDTRQLVREAKLRGEPSPEVPVGEVASKA